MFLTIGWNSIDLSFKYRKVIEKKNMKTLLEIFPKIVGVLLVILGFLLGAYLGVWVCFIGGIVGFINEIKAVETNSMTVAISIAKVLFSGLVGWVSAIGLFVPGFYMISRK